MKKCVNQFSIHVDCENTTVCTIFLKEGDTFKPFDVIVRSFYPLTDWEASIKLIHPEGEEFNIDGKAIIPRTGTQVEASWDLWREDAPLIIRVIRWVEEQPNSLPCQLEQLQVTLPDVCSSIPATNIWIAGNVWQLEPRSGVNSEAGLTEFIMRSLSDGAVISAERTDSNTGGLAIFPDDSRIECCWGLDFDDMCENNNLCITISTPVLDR